MLRMGGLEVHSQVKSPYPEQENGPVSIPGNTHLVGKMCG